MGCSQTRRELLEHFAFREELEARSAPHLAHLESCAECRREMGIDRALVMNLRRALGERVARSAPSGATWELVRRRTVDRQVQPWSGRLLRWSRMLPAVVAGIFLFANAAAPGTGALHGAPSLVSATSALSTRHVVPPLEEAASWQLLTPTVSHPTQAVPPLPGWPMATRLDNQIPANLTDPPIDGRMR